MDFEAYKEQFLESFNTYKNKVVESDLYIQLKERYDNLQPNVQTLIKVGASFLIIYFFYSIPASFVSASQEKMEFFNDNRDLTRNLIRAGRIDRHMPFPPPATSSSSMQSAVESKMRSLLVLPEQKLSLGPKSDVASKSFVHKNVIQNGLQAKFKKLTLKQAIKIAETMENVRGSELINLSIIADKEDPHYFNVEYEMASFSVKKPIKKIVPSKKSKKKKSKKKKNRKGKKK